jgi:hypothetical protein
MSQRSKIFFSHDDEFTFAVPRCILLGDIEPTDEEGYF